MTDHIASNLSFENTQIAFSNQSNQELRQSYWLFRLMQNAWLVEWGSRIGAWALRVGLPVKWIIRMTIFQQFVGGESLRQTEPIIQLMAQSNVLTILDYGVEAKSTDAEMEHTADELIGILEFTTTHPNVPVISCKISALAEHDLLEKVSNNASLTEAEMARWHQVEARVDRVCAKAATSKTALFIDAEESWIQPAIDKLCMQMILKYNTTHKAVIYSTLQLYRLDRYDALLWQHAEVKKAGVLYGAKLVRGAYMEKERDRAEEQGYPSPIHADKDAVNADYNRSLEYCLDNLDSISFCAATHNEESCLYLAGLIDGQGIERRHPRINFCQLYGMSDHITYNLAEAGYTASKYVPYGPIKEVVPYLVRRARENTSVEGQVGREFQLIKRELQRRKKSSNT